ncbi:hypothetical protein M885DRAFT_506837 [Pelagophyceae sp. CCMP2097]|nr:hypothetical protein M885DRAFT_506837 [Pelagophyceae sp. CCMP2097]
MAKREMLFDVGPRNAPAPRSAPRLESLTALCSEVLSRNFESIESAGPLPPEQYAVIVSRSSASPQFVAGFEDAHPWLASSTSDAGFWRPRCAAAERKGCCPLPLLEDKIRRHKTELDAAVSAAKMTTGARAALTALESTPMPVEVLQSTGVGKALSRFAKLETAAQPQARAILGRWKARARTQLQREDERAPGAAEDDDVLVDGLRTCATWRQLFELSAKVEALKRDRFSQRAKEMYASESKRKPSVQVAPTHLRPTKRSRSSSDLCSGVPSAVSVAEMRHKWSVSGRPSRPPPPRNPAANAPRAHQAPRAHPARAHPVPRSRPE